MRDKSVHLLLVEDDALDRERVQRAVAESGAVDVTLEEARDMAAGLAALRATRFDCALVDFRLPDGDALALLRALHDGPGADTPVVVLTGLDDEATALAALQLGAQDYLVKDEIHGPLLLRAVRYAIERRQVAEALRRSESNFRSLADRSPDGVCIHRDGVLAYINPAFFAALGHQGPDGLVGRSVYDFLVDEDTRARVRARVATVHATGQHAPRLEVRMLRADGEVVTLETTASAIDLDGSPATLVMARDVTEHRQMQARLLLSDRMASVGTLAVGVAHEINNPLSYISANLDMMVEEIRALSGGSPSGRMRDLEEMANEARLGAEMIRRIVRGLTTFSREYAEQHVALDVHRVLDLSINMAFHDIRHRARLVKDYGTVPAVLADEVRLGQVFINLLVNAAQAMPEGQADRHEIRLTTRTDATGRAVVEVRDTGPGIPREDLSQVFDPFFTTKPVGEGTGLGLSICHGVVTALGGEIQVESTVGLGTTFRVTLPAASTEPSTPPNAQSSRPSVAPHGDLLIVDDDAMVGAALRRILRREHQVTLVENGRAALDLITAGRRFDVILCDLMMPVMTGMDLYAALEQSAPDQRDRMIFVSGGISSPSARAFLDDVPNPRIEKPFDMHNLRALVRTVLVVSGPTG